MWPQQRCWDAMSQEGGKVLVVRVDNGPIVGVAIVQERSEAPFEVQAKDILLRRDLEVQGMDMRAKQRRLDMLVMANNEVHRRNDEGPTIMSFLSE